ncbi:hypothetical protein AA309_18925 [Microvirga vignae]|uniref:GGDEF domain-containing protein n=1 Tax=Microvirga vignae TaxID=1225564 RepID=A0A0H1R9W6_9HYPH|nr:GGDEF domain-containing protein [Microvirga vignae]KLK91666.1 hypothetical protein AA309_18925 [Microvirga vignae]
MPPSYTNSDEEIEQTLIGLMYTALPSIIIVVTGYALAGSMAAVRTNDLLTYVILAAGLSIGLYRIAVIVAYHLVLRCHGTLNHKVWEALYGLGGFIFSICVGSLTSRTLIVGDVESQLLTVTTAIAYSTGMIIRVAVRPKIAVAQLSLMHIPVICIGFWFFSPTSVALSFLHILFLTAGVQLIYYIHDTLAARLRAERELAALARHDYLTGLPNRAFLEHHLTELLSRSSSPDPIVLMTIDLDGFKQVNDRMGHLAGDEVLRQTASTLKETVGPERFVARLGGDEFVVVAKADAALGDPEHLADQIIAAVSKPIKIDGEFVSVGASVGLAEFDRSMSSVIDLIGAADSALYAAKAAGKSTTRRHMTVGLAPLLCRAV